MSTGFASARCIRCGAYTEGVGQFCNDCLDRQRADEAARAEQVAQAIAERPAAASSAAVGGACPSCGRVSDPGASSCGFCRFQLRTIEPGEGEMAYAGFWIRFLAAFVDLAILFVMCVFVATLAPNILTAFLAQILVAALYLIGFWIGQGATPGKMAVGIKVVMANGLPIEFGPACLRYLGYIASAFTLGIGFLMIAFTAEKRGLHDNIAGTVVIKSR